MTAQGCPLFRGDAHLVTCLWKSVSCLCVTWMAPPVVSLGKPFSEFSSQRQNVCGTQETDTIQDATPRAGGGLGGSGADPAVLTGRSICMISQSTSATSGSV